MTRSLLHTALRRMLLAIAVFAAACTPTPSVSTSQTDNDAIVVSKLFTHEGCSVYRFEADGYYRYYAHCGGPATVMQDEIHNRSCGKNCTKRVMVPNDIETKTKAVSP